MSLEKRIEEEALRLKTMGWAFLLLAAFACSFVYLLPDSDAFYLLSVEGKKGFYVLSAFFGFLGVYCLGAVWRRRNYL